MLLIVDRACYTMLYEKTGPADFTLKYALLTYSANDSSYQKSVSKTLIIAKLKSQQTDTDTAQQIEELNGKIRELVEKESPRLIRGKLLYDEIRKDGTTSGWSNDDYKCFIDYYKAIDFAAYSRIQKKHQPKTAHNTFFLILYEMGMEDKDVRRIMGITQEAIRIPKQARLPVATSDATLLLHMV